MIPKPRHCKVDWLEMTKTEGGRTCYSCNKKITDFSKMNWPAIEKIHLETPGQVCGMYAKKQLKNWGQEPPKRKLPSCGKSLLLISSLLATIPAYGQNTLSDSIETQQNVPLPAINQTAKKAKNSAPVSFIISGTIIDSIDKEPLINANILIQGTTRGTFTDLDGNFHLDITDIWEMAKNTVVEISYTGYDSKIIKISDLLQEQVIIELNWYNIHPNALGITNFGVAKPSPLRNTWWKIKYFFRKRK